VLQPGQPAEANAREEAREEFSIFFFAMYMQKNVLSVHNEAFREGARRERKKAKATRNGSEECCSSPRV
jgi:hypothetical protein